MTSYFLLIAGIVLLFIGGESLVYGCVRIARLTGLSELLIGAIIMGFGTSTPELVVSVEAVLDNLPEIALGNVVGSNLSNTLLVLGLAATLSPVACLSKQLRRDAMAGVIAAIALATLSLYGTISRGTGLLFFLCLCLYLSVSIWKEKSTPRVATSKQASQPIQLTGWYILFSICFVFIGLLCLITGAHYLITGAVNIATQYGISDAVIGLTVIAIGTSLPELFTVLVASYRKHNDMIIGNILGSNLFNILSIVGLTAIIKPIPFQGQIAQQDVWLMTASAIVLLLLISLKKNISSLTGAILVCSYFAYLYFLYA